MVVPDRTDPIRKTGFLMALAGIGFLKINESVEIEILLIFNDPAFNTGNTVQMKF